MAIRQVRGIDDEILRKKSKDVERIDDRIRTILNDMVETMHKMEGIGLAAPQIGILKRLIVIDLYDDNGPFKLVNPKIIKQKGEQIAEEGCLSIPNKYAKVKRPLEITVEALDEFGAKVKIEAKEVMAVVLSHELDHLEGELFVDKMIEGTLEYVNSENAKNKKV